MQGDPIPLPNSPSRSEGVRRNRLISGEGRDIHVIKGKESGGEKGEANGAAGRARRLLPFAAPTSRRRGLRVTRFAFPRQPAKRFPAAAVSPGNAKMYKVANMANKWRKEKDKEKDKDKDGAAAQEEDKMMKVDETMAWKFLSDSQIHILLEQDIAGVQKCLEEFLDLKLHKTSLKEAVLLDYYVSGFWWAKQMNFTTVQIAGFMTMLNLLLENLSTQHLTLVENIQELRRMMAGIGQCPSEKSGGFQFFTVNQAKDIIGYLEISLFQHYMLYEYLFHISREELVIGDEYVVELVKPADTPLPAPLEEGLPYDIYSTFIALTPGAEDEIKQEIEGGIHAEEQPEAEPTVDPLASYCIDDVKPLLNKMTNEVIVQVQAEINEKLQIQEEAFSVRIEKLKKA